MTKAELAVKIAKGAGLTKEQAEKALNGFIAFTTAALKADEKVTLVGFGTFSAVARPARVGRNPKTGKALQIAARTGAKFAPGKALKDLKANPAGKTAPKAKPPAKKK